MVARSEVEVGGVSIVVAYRSLDSSSLKGLEPVVDMVGRKAIENSQGLVGRHDFVGVEDENFHHSRCDDLGNHLALDPVLGHYHLDLFLGRHDPVP